MPSTTTVSLTDENLDEARRALLDAVSEITGYFVVQVDKVRQCPASALGVVAEDVQGSRHELDRLLRALDALGWPSMAHVPDDAMAKP